MNNNKKTKKRFSLIITLLIVIAGAIAYWQYSSNNSAPPVSKDTPTANTPNRSTAGSRRPPMPPVQVATSTQEDVPQFLTALGTVKAVN
ncbi:multidrug transporter subunit MdtA, partial [Providencia huaxiensis]